MMMSQQQLTLEQALRCAKCNTVARTAQEHESNNYEAGEIILIECPGAGCKETSWFYCKSCKRRAYRNNLSKHHTRKKHLKCHEEAYPPPLPPPPDPPADAFEPFLSFPDGGAPADNDSPVADDAAMQIIDELMETDLANAFMANADGPMETLPVPEQKGSQYPRINMKGNEWLQKAMKDYPMATITDLRRLFSAPGLEGMGDFWTAELMSGEGRCGGGLCLIVAIAFQQATILRLDENRIPDFEEALWHFDSMVQCHSMNDKQRQRQHRITRKLMEYFPKDSFFKTTYIPEYKALGRHYGNTGQHSIFRNLPIPKAEKIGDVAYMSPLKIIASMFCNGTPIDNIQLRAPGMPSVDECREPGPHQYRVHNVEQCRKAVVWKDKVTNQYLGAPDSTDSNFGAPKKTRCIGIYEVGWKDGFGTNSVKNNRAGGNVDVKSVTFSPPKDLVNATENTFAVAIGLKKAKGWPEVEHRYRKDIEALTQLKEPMLLYHGVTQKMVPVFFRQFAFLADRVERKTVTATVQYNSDTHRCFGVAGLIKTPAVRKDELKQFLRTRTASTRFGWCERFISGAGDRNGARFPACLSCRKRGLRKLGIVLPRSNANSDNSPCSKCANWDLLAHKGGLVDFQMHPNYPIKITEGSPVPPPEGRDVFASDGKLPSVKLDWDFLKQACKFMFYQASRRKGSWNQSESVCYLTHCGVSPEISVLLFKVAKACRKKDDEQDYRSDEGTGGFPFPSPWCSKGLALPDFVETVMHTLFLGVQESNMELITMWLSGAPVGLGLASATFRAVLQGLIKDLRPFMLSWLQAYPLTGGEKKGGLGTGSWVSENWGFLVRISPFIFAWCNREPSKASTCGVDDVSRMVVAFNGFVARCLTHNGVDDAFIAEMHLYLNEFLSAVREFDIRVCHKTFDDADKAKLREEERKMKRKDHEEKGSKEKRQRKRSRRMSQPSQRSQQSQPWKMAKAMLVMVSSRKRKVRLQKIQRHFG